MSPRTRLGWRTVFGGIAARLRTDLPADLRDFRWNYSGIMAKASYGNRLLHYEIWVRPRLGVVEIGLHFEEDALTNARLYGAFRARSKEVKRKLGADARIAAAITVSNGRDMSALRRLASAKTSWPREVLADTARPLAELAKAAQRGG